MNNTPYEIFGDADSGHLRIFTERDRTTLDQARTIMSRFGKALPTNKALSGKVTREDIVAVEPIEKELESLKLYRAPTSEQLEEFARTMNRLTLKELKEYPITIWIKGEDGAGIKSTTTVGDFIRKYQNAEGKFFRCKHKAHFIGELCRAFMHQKEKRMHIQIKTALGRINTACDRAGLPRRRYGEWVDA